MKFYDDYKRAEAEWKTLKVFSEKKEVSAYSYIMDCITEEIEEMVQDRDECEDESESEPETEDEDEVVTIEELEKDMKINRRSFKLNDWSLVKRVVENEEDIVKGYKFLNRFFEGVKKPEFTMQTGTYFKIEKLELEL